MSEAIDVDKIKSLDDAPEAARRFARQEYLNQYFKPVALAPFVIVLALVFWTKLPDAIGIPLVYFALLWALGVVGYAVYLRFALKCPVCGWRYGIGQKCSSCGLPRHPEKPMSTLLPPDIV